MCLLGLLMVIYRDLKSGWIYNIELSRQSMLDLSDMKSIYPHAMSSKIYKMCITMTSIN